MTIWQCHKSQKPMSKDRIQNVKGEKWKNLGSDLFSNNEANLGDSAIEKSEANFEKSVRGSFADFDVFFLNLLVAAFRTETGEVRWQRSSYLDSVFHELQSWQQGMTNLGTVLTVHPFLVDRFEDVHSMSVSLFHILKNTEY